MSEITTAQLPLIWAGILGIAVAFYVILDGSISASVSCFRSPKMTPNGIACWRRSAPFWDGNETWLVLGGGGLLVAFPRAYSIIMPAFYLPLIVMLLALVLRGVTFEFRAIALRKPMWNAIFAVGSTLAGLCQGFILGGLVQGVKVEMAPMRAARSDWATPFGLMCALASWRAMRCSARPG